MTVAVDGVLNFLRGVHSEMVSLSQHGSYPAHLEHEPLQDFKLGAVGFGEKFSGFGGQVQQNRARLEQMNGFAVGSVGVHEGRDFVVGTDI